MRKLRVRLLMGMLAVMAFSAAESLVTPVKVSAVATYEEVCCGERCTDGDKCEFNGPYACCIPPF